MKNKKIILALVAFLAVVAVMVGIMLANQPKPNDPGTSTTSGQQGQSTTSTAYAKTITVIVVHKDGTEKTFTYRTNEQYLGTVLYAEGLIVADEANSGMFDTVDGEKADWSADQSYWAFYVGEDYATKGVDETLIQDGDHFRLVYTRG